MKHYIAHINEMDAEIEAKSSLKKIHMSDLAA